MPTSFRGKERLVVAVPPGGPLLLLQADLLDIGVVPVALLHEALVRPVPGVGGRNAVLHLVELARKLREVVVLFRLGAAKRIEVSNSQSELNYCYFELLKYYFLW